MTFHMQHRYRLENIIMVGCFAEEQIQYQRTVAMSVKAADNIYSFLSFHKIWPSQVKYDTWQVYTWHISFNPAETETLRIHVANEINAFLLHSACYFWAFFCGLQLSVQLLLERKQRRSPRPLASLTPSFITARPDPHHCTGADECCGKIATSVADI